MSERETIIREYLEAGKRLTLIKKNGKAPILKDWPTKAVSEKRLLKHSGNIGMVIKEGDLVVDVDPRNGGLESLTRMERDLSVRIPRMVETARRDGGFHGYMYLPTGWRVGLLKKLPEYPGIELLGVGSQVVIPTSTIDGKEYRWLDPDFGCFEAVKAPLGLLSAFAAVGADGTKSAEDHAADEGDGDVVDAGSEDLGDFEGLISGGGGADAAWPEKRVMGVLGALDPGMGNDEWVKVGMALKVWHPVRGAEVWEMWSRGGDNWVEGECEKRWRSFDVAAVEGGVTMGTIVHMAREEGWEESASKDALGRVKEYVERLRAATSVEEVRVSICQSICREPWGMIDELARGQLAVEVQKALHRITESKPAIGACRGLIAPALVGDEEAPEWCHNWVYVNSHRGYVNFRNLQIYKKEAFNLMNTHRIAGSGMMATNWAASTGYIKIVDGMAYLPTHGDERVVEIDGKKVVNAFTECSVPRAAKAYSVQGRAAIHRVKKHVRFLCGDDKGKAKLFIQWLAHQVQYPGVLIHWCPVFCGIEGLGKSALAELLRAVLGFDNIGVVAPAQVVSKFNSWAIGNCVNVLEELKVTGHNRYDAMNAIKPLITDSTILVEEKGVDPYKVRNVTNYLILTNHLDALALLLTDRRYWMNQVPISSLSQLKDHVGESVDEYFPALFEAIRDHGSELRRWLIRVEITEEFKNTNQAPMTEFKGLAVATEEAGIVGLTEVKALLDEGGEYFNRDVICSRALWDQMLFKHSVIEITNQEKHRLLKRLQFQKIPKPVKIKGKAWDVWVRFPMNNAKIRKRLER
jgi:hypothetical protein